MDRENDLIFHETQRYSWVVNVVCIGVLLIPTSIAWLASFFCPIAGILLIFVAGIVAIHTLFLCICKLETKVDTNGLYVRFFPAHMRFKEIPVQDIIKYHIQTYCSFDYGKIWFGGIRY